ncbi:MAG: hypothetical protein CVU57_29945 [Deltaproteobacteria bacterium HGW-Deltaproteobacteria-15]|jgi:PAS domain S-box-containing protein|nr:MAG: hypothetical protein CVU57_29945 [Deltaproteobacteria bacterium HGW-Deltaproteobacteria-15]
MAGKPTYENLVEHLPQRVFIKDLNSVYVWCNARYAQDLGISPDQIVGKDDFAFYPEELADGYRSDDRAVMTSGTRRDIEEKYRLAGEERWVQTVKVPYHDDHGQIAGIVGMVEDITARRLSEKTLRASEEKYRILVENAGEAIFVAQEGMLKFVNAKTSEMIGITGSDLTSRPFIEFIHPDDRELVLARHMKRQQGLEAPSRYSFRIVTRAGVSRWVELNAVRIEWEGKPGTLNFLADITERKQTEEALLLSEERFRVAFQTSPDAINVNRMRDGLYVAVNEGFTFLTGFTWEDVKGKTSLEIDIWADVAQRRKLVEGLRDRGKVTNLEASFRLKDGSVKTGLMSARVILLENEPHILSVTRDIDEFKRTQTALKEADAGYRQLFENMSDIVFVHDEEGCLVSVNPAVSRVLKFNEEDLVGKCLKEFLADTHKEAFQPHLERSLIGPTEDTIGMVSGDGRTCWLEYSSTPFKSDDGRTYVSGMARDVTERIEAEEKLRLLQAQLLQAQKMESVGRLAGGVAHDFNNMLQAIIGNAEMAVMNAGENDPLQRHLQQILDSAQRSASVVRQLLAFARKQTASPKVLDLNDTVSAMLKMLQRLVGEDIDMIWIPGHKLWRVKIDPSQIDQILANLVVNARDAIAGAGKVTIETDNAMLDEVYCSAHKGVAPGEYVQLMVSDDGTGMTEEILEHLFEPFFTTKEPGRGTGLGLSTIYGIVKQNNGFVNVYSEPGEGTTFKIYLPRFATTVMEAREKSEYQSPRGGTETVLIVEDEESILDIGREILNRLGYTVLSARTPSHALRLAGEHTGDIQLLITDVVMPEMNGKELADRIVSIKPGLKCLYMSGYTANVIAHHGFLDEGVHFINKPFSLRDLAAKVREVLDME